MAGRFFRIMAPMNYLFDLDGTLLDTLHDIKDALNDALKEIGIPLSYTYEESKRLIGSGAETLMHRALGPMDEESRFSALKKAFLPRYLSYQGIHTSPFPGVVEVLEALKARGDSLFIVSNKPDAMAQDIVRRCLPYSLFSRVLGHKDGDPVKPNPIQVERIFRDFRLRPEDSVFVGDSAVDALTAKAAGLPCLLCLYGYGHYDEALLASVTGTLSNFRDLLHFSPIQNPGVE